MTGTLALLASSTRVVAALSSTGQRISTWMPCESRFSTWLACLVASSLAHWMTSSAPTLSASSCMYLMSYFQRGCSSVFIATPTLTFWPLAAAAGVAPPAAGAVVAPAAGAVVAAAAGALVAAAAGALVGAAAAGALVAADDDEVEAGACWLQAIASMVKPESP